MSIIRTHKNNNYSVINNLFLEDKNLSWKAKGLYIYLVHNKNKDFKISLNDLCLKSTDNMHSTRMSLLELINLKYIQRKRDLKNGKFNGYIYTIL